MRLLLDSHILIWALSEPERFPAQVRAEIQSRANAVSFSAASMWELAIKTAVGRMRLALSVQELLDAAFAAGFEEMPVRSNVALRVASLPMHHGDPFDRLLVAQAMEAPATLLTSDRVLARYSSLVSIVEAR